MGKRFYTSSNIGQRYLIYYILGCNAGIFIQKNWFLHNFENLYLIIAQYGP